MGVLVSGGESKKEGLRGFGACTWSRGAFLYTNLGFSMRRFIYTLMINSVAAIET